MTTRKRVKVLPIERANEADENSVVLSSGNVFADLGFDDAEERLMKMRMVVGVKRLIEEKGLTQVEAARLLGTTQPKISELWNNKLSSITFDKLAEWYVALGKNVKIEVSTPKRNEQPHLEVAVA